MGDLSYNPTVNNFAGQAALSGLQSAGADIAGGMKQMQQNALMGQQATAKFLGAAQANPDILQFLSSDNAPQELASAFSSLQKGGSLPVQKAALLAQFAETYTQGKAQQQDQQLRAQQIAMGKQKLAGMQQLFGGDGAGGQGVSPQGQAPAQTPQQPQGGAQLSVPPNDNAPRAIMQPPAPVTISSPQIKAMYPQALRMTFGDPDKATTLLQQQADAINANAKANYDRMVATEKSTGNLYFKRIDYKNGMPQATIYVPEVAVGPGTANESLKEGPNEISVPLGQQPPGKIVLRGGGDSSAPATPYNTNDQDWQKDVKDAYQQQASSAGLLADAKQLKDAATAYATGGSNKLNVLLGDPTYAKIKQMFTGANPLNDLQIAMAANTNAVLAQIRMGNGSTGGRIMQTEYENAAKVLGSGTMTNQSLLAAANNIYNLSARQNDIDKAYATYRSQMPSGDAEKLAVQQFGAPPDLKIGGANAPAGFVRVKSPAGAIGTIPVGKLDAAKAQGYTPVQ